MQIGPVSLIPWGLANLLGIKGGDGTFNSIESVLQPTFDVLPLLANGNALESVTQVVNANAVGGLVFSSLTVPQGEAWLVRGAAFACATGAAELFRAKAAVLNSFGFGVLGIGTEMVSSLTDAAAASFCSTTSLAPFMLMPGDRIQLVIERITTAGNIAVTGTASIYRFRA